MVTGLGGTYRSRPWGLRVHVQTQAEKEAAGFYHGLRRTSPERRTVTSLASQAQHAAGRASWRKRVGGAAATSSADSPPAWPALRAAPRREERERGGLQSAGQAEAPRARLRRETAVAERTASRCNCVHVHGP